MANRYSVQAYVGTFRRLGGAGIYTVGFDSRAMQFGQLAVAAEIADPIYLALSPQRDFLYSVAATDVDSRQGLVVAYRVDGSSRRLVELNRRMTGGTAACHVSVDRAGSIVTVAHYNSGSICAVRIDPSGALADATQTIQHRGASIHPQRQTKPHPHSAVFDISGGRLVVCDLGTDQLTQYEVARDGAAPLREPGFALKIEPGAGPRHFVFHPILPMAYVVNEIVSTVTAVSYTPAHGLTEVIESWPTLPRGWTGTNTAGAIRLNSVGDRLYVTNRGHDSIATFAVDLARGTLELLEHTTSGGKTPRDCVLTSDGSAMLVANQDSGTVAAFAIDPSTGVPRDAGAMVAVPGAVAILL